MRKTHSLLLIIISASLLSACVAKTPPIENQAAEEKKPEAEQSQSSSLRDLLALGQNQKCTFTATDTQNNVKTDTSATLYISGKKMYEEIQMVSSDKAVPTTNMAMISDGTYIYTWDVSKKMPGMKIKIVEPTPGTTEDTKTQSVDMDKKFDMKCSSWMVDDSKFVVPTDVKFTDLTEMMKNIPTMPANIPTGN